MIATRLNEKYLSLPSLTGMAERLVIMPRTLNSLKRTILQLQTTSLKMSFLLLKSQE